jgi:hypothetical protein
MVREFSFTGMEVDTIKTPIQMYTNIAYRIVFNIKITISFEKVNQVQDDP